jgi:uncharacterized protein (DUF1015 family)
MSIVRPFRGLRPPKDKVLKVVCPPYDVVSTEEARDYAKGNPLCFFHVSRPEIGLPAGTDSHADEVYDLGLANLERFKAEGILARDETPCLYLYRQQMGGHVQVGLCAAASVEEYQRGLIKKHELTRADKEDDRTRHIDRLGANDEPVFLTYRSRPSLNALVARLTAEPSEYDFKTEDGIGHSFWVVDGESDIRALASEMALVPALYVADGHHRSAAAARVRDARRRSGSVGEAEHDTFLAVLFPHDQMRIMDYNRVVKDLNDLRAADFLERIAERFSISPASGKSPDEPHQFGMYLEGAWRRLTARTGSFDEKDPVAALDVSILQRNLLEPILGIKDPRTDRRIDFVGGIRGMAALERLVDQGKAAVAFSLFPTRIEELLAIADAGQIMPPKSTWFEPKLRSGLVLHELG